MWDSDIEGQPQLSMGSEELSYGRAAEYADVLSRGVSEYYRCPENFFDCFLAEKLVSGKGYFRFGPKAICYGESRSGRCDPQAAGCLYDTLSDVSIDGEKLCLPFDPSEIINNLRLERYRTGGVGSDFQRVLKRLY
jgi:hypothetical protein